MVASSDPSLPARPIRLHPEYTLVALETLGSDQRSVIERGGGAGTAAVLLPRHGDGPTYGLSARAQRLLERVLATGEDQSSAALASETKDLATWVLDGVLQLRVGHLWRSGPQTVEDLALPTPPSADNAAGALESLSRAALDYTASLRLRTVGDMARRLYCYHRWPASPSWSRRLATTAAVRAWLDAPETATALARDWVSAPPPPDNDRWRIFRHRSTTAGLVPGPRYKLYVSPRPDNLRDALGVALGAFTEHEVPVFKVADDLYGVLRPDKLVAYFSSRSQLKSVVAELRRTAARLPAQGVPFTAACTQDGLLSWAVDPPQRADAHSGVSSWRGWLVGRMAQAMIQAQAEASWGPASVVDYVLRRLWLDGVDATTWAPLDTAGADRARIQ